MNVLPAPALPSGMQRESDTQEATKATLQGALVAFPVLAAFLIGMMVILIMVLARPKNVLAARPIHAGENSSASPNTSLSPIFTKEVQAWAAFIQDWAAEFDLDPNLIATVMQIESCGFSEAQSSSGALGLFQVMPFHFSQSDDPLDPDTNAARGLAYLAGALDLSEGNASLAMAGYNGGHGVIGLPPSDWAEETRRYVYWGSGIAEELARGVGESERIKQWLAAGGESLCRQASVALGLE